MKELIYTSELKFFSASINQLICRCSHKEKCAIIIDENYLDELLTKGTSVIGKCVNQIIIISENVDAPFSQLKGKDVLLVAASNLEGAIRLAVFGAPLSNKIICILNKEEETLIELIELVVS